jgi:hypothetical protein
VVTINICVTDLKVYPHGAKCCRPPHVDGMASFDYRRWLDEPRGRVAIAAIR